MLTYDVVNLPESESHGRAELRVSGVQTHNEYAKFARDLYLFVNDFLDGVHFLKFESLADYDFDFPNLDIVKSSGIFLPGSDDLLYTIRFDQPSGDIVIQADTLKHAALLEVYRQTKTNT